MAMCTVLSARSRTSISVTGKYAKKTTEVHAMGTSIGQTVLGPSMMDFMSYNAPLCSRQGWLASLVGSAQGADAGEHGLCGPAALMCIGAV
jgi:hypothetical protein